MLNPDSKIAAQILINQIGERPRMLSNGFILSFQDYGQLPPAYFFRGLCGSTVSTNGYLFRAFVAVVLGSVTPLT